MTAPVERPTLATVVEHLAYEAGRSADAVLGSRCAYDVWLRRLAVWLARHVVRLTRDEINAGLGRGFDASSQDLRFARRLWAGDAEFRRLYRIVAPTLVTP